MFSILNKLRFKKLKWNWCLLPIFLGETKIPPFSNNTIFLCWDCHADSSIFYMDSSLCSEWPSVGETGRKCCAFSHSANNRGVIRTKWGIFLKGEASSATDSIRHVESKIKNQPSKIKNYFTLFNPTRFLLPSTSKTWTETCSCKEINCAGSST